MSILQMRSYVARHFALALDGYQSMGFIRSVEGGGVKAEVVNQKVGGSAFASKHVAVPQQEPFTVQVGLSMARGFAEWIAKSWSGEVARHNGSVLTIDRDMRVRHEQHFSDALILETQMPALDARSKEPAYMTVKFMPESSRHLPTPGIPTFRGDFPSLQKSWSPSNFRLELDGIDARKVSRIDSFTVKQGVKRLETGLDRNYQLEPSSLEYPNLSVTLPVASAQTWFKWHQDFVVDGKNDASQEKTGSIVLLSNSLKSELLRVNLFGVGIANLSMEKGDASGDSIKNVKADLYVERMEFKYGLGIGPAVF